MAPNKQEHECNCCEDCQKKLKTALREKARGLDTIDHRDYRIEGLELEIKKLQKPRRFKRELSRSVSPPPSTSDEKVKDLEGKIRLLQERNTELVNEVVALQNEVGGLQAYAAAIRQNLQKTLQLNTPDPFMSKAGPRSIKVAAHPILDPIMPNEVRHNVHELVPTPNRNGGEPVTMPNRQTTVEAPAEQAGRSNTSQKRTLQERSGSAESSTSSSTLLPSANNENNNRVPVAHMTQIGDQVSTTPATPRPQISKRRLSDSACDDFLSHNGKRTRHETTTLPSTETSEATDTASILPPVPKGVALSGTPNGTDAQNLVNAPVPDSQSTAVDSPSQSAARVGCQGTARPPVSRPGPLTQGTPSSGPRERNYLQQYREFVNNE